MVGEGPYEPKEFPAGSVIVKVISLSHAPPLKMNSTASPAKVDKESDPEEPVDNPPIC